MNSEIFRLAAILYADNNYEVSPKTIHRKIIESIFIENKNIFLGIHSLIDQIKARYTFDFTEEEIKEIVSNVDFFNTSRCKIEELKIMLTAKRFENISKKINTNNLDFFIEEFQKVNTSFELKDLKQIIYKFLYEVFQTNVLSFSKLINPNIQIQELLNINDHNLNATEIEIINRWLLRFDLCQ